MRRDPIAVVGIGCRFPGGIFSAQDLWSALLEGRDAVGPVPEDRWSTSAYWAAGPPRAGFVRSRRGGFLGDVDKFDAQFFGFFPKEADNIDPQQRLLLEVAYECLADAGAPVEEIAGAAMGVFVGSFMYDYLCAQTASTNRRGIGPYTGMGSAVTSIANRISYCFDLRGPSLTVDTACSSSLMAIHLACRAIWGGDCSSALAGGVNLLLRPESTIALSQGGFLSPTGSCKVFDASADGYVRSEGVGVVYLKPLLAALRDRDEVYAVVLGGAANHGGYVAEGFTVPNEDAQRALLTSAYADAGVDPARVSYVEAHGTGTPVGDPIETRAIGSVLGLARPNRERCLIGSLKANLGHLEGAAGVAGFIKAVLVAKHGQAPPNIHLVEPNPLIDFRGLRLEVPTQVVALDASDVVTGVNAFGAGGSNAHVVLARHVPAARPASRAGEPSRLRLFRFAARSPEALKAVAATAAERVDGRARLDDLAYSQLVRQSRHTHQLVVAADDAAELGEKLRAFAAGKLPAGAQAIEGAFDRPPKVAFVYSGQGGQWAEMGAALMASEPAFAGPIHEIDGYLRELGGPSVIEELGRPAASARVDQTVVAQATIMAVQVALTSLFADYGLVPDAVAGHSIGEVAAAWASGALTLRQASAVIYHRARIQARAAGQGRMLAVGLPRAEAEALIAPLVGRVSLAASNGPAMVALAGEAGPLESIAADLEAKGTFNRFVNVEVPYHSHYMEPLEDELRASLDPYRGVATTRALFSTVTARREEGTHLDGAYWYANVRQPVQFAETVGAMVEAGCQLFVEIGPHPVLVAGTKGVLEQRGVFGLALPAMHRREPPRETFAKALGVCQAMGAPIAAERVAAPDARFVRPSPYPWQRTHHWLESPEAAERRLRPFAHPFLESALRLVTEDPLRSYRLAIHPSSSPYLADHRVDGVVVVPGTAHLDLALAAAAHAFPNVDVFLEDVRFESAIVVPEGDERLDARLEIRSQEGKYAISSRVESAGQEPAWTIHSTGTINAFHDAFPSKAADLAAVRARMTEADRIDVAGLYDTVRAAGLGYGPMFRAITDCYHRGDEVLARLELPVALEAEAARHAFHPALLDACVHAIFAHTLARGDGQRIYLPSRVDRVRVSAGATTVVWSHIRVSTYTEPRVVQDVCVFDDAGRPLVEMQGFEALYLEGAQAERPKGHVYEWTPAALGEGGTWFANVPRQLVLVGRPGATAELARRVSESEPPASFDLGDGPAESPEPFDADWRSLLAPLTLDRRTEIVLFADCLVARAPERFDAEPGPALEARMTRAAGRLISIAKTLVALEAVPGVTLVTRGAAHAEGETMDLAEASLHGIVRVLRNECPNIRFRVVDLDRTLSDADALVCVAAELQNARADLAELEVSHRAGARFVRRLVAVPQRATTRLPARGAAYAAEVKESGSLDSVSFRETFAPMLPHDGVEIDVLAAGLGFRDVQAALGMLPSGDAGAGPAVLGREVAGVLRRVGPGVKDLKPGEGVVAICLSGLSGRVVVPRHHVARKPASLSFPEAAALPIAAVTATYGLVHAARLEPGDTVLIHSASGGVGHAALRLAAAIGARVIATAGSAARRDYLRSLGVEHVFDSRAVDFFDGVMRATDGRGADVVLNALQGRLLTQSLRCLAPHGRFIELGSGHRNGRLDVGRLADNRSFHVVDVEGLAAARPELFQQLFERAIALYDGRDAAAALPIETRPVGEIVLALKHLARGQHVGKVVLTTDEAEIVAAPPSAPLVRPDRTYLVTGGASGFGLHVARWLAEAGARHLALVSRSGPKTDVDRAIIADIERRGVRVVLRNADIADADTVDKLVEALDRGGPPLAGIVHSAGLLDDVRLEGMTRARFSGVVRPKAIGAWNLHRATLKHGIELEQFVFVSSISSVFGLYGQTNYAAANYALDTLAHHRRAQGLAATSINFGVLGRYAGMSGADGAGTMLGLLEGQGWKIMGLLATLGFVREAFAERPTQRLAALLDFEKFGKAHAHSLRDVRLAHLYAEGSAAGQARGRRSSLREALEGLPPGERVEATVEALRATLARILGMSPSALDVDEPLDRLALDSLMLTQLRNWIFRELEVSVPIMKMMRGPSLRTLAADVLGSDGAEGAAEQKVESDTALPPELQARGPWIVEGGGLGAPVRMFCFHSMGVGASLFSRFLVEPPKGVHPLAVQTPGRENRAAESAATNVSELAAAIAATLAPELDRPYFFWGHSFGGIVAFEVIRKLRALGLAPPGHFVVTGTIAPHLSRLWQRREAIKLVEIAENTPDYLLSLSRYVEDMDFLRAVFPRMRADMPLLASYRFQDDRPLEIPVTAFSARQDEIVYKDEILGWREHTKGAFDLVEVDGDHWFLNRNRTTLVARLEAIAASLGAKPDPRRHDGTPLLPVPEATGLPQSTASLEPRIQSSDEPAG